MLTGEDRARIAGAVTAAEALSDGEIVTVVAPSSDTYHDVVLHWTFLLVLLGLGLVAAFPGHFLAAVEPVAGGWSAVTPGEFVASLIVLVIVLFLVGRFVFAIPAIRIALTPGPTRLRRVRRRALLLFRLSAENRTRARTGVLIYLSVAERRAELVADRAINAKVTPETWGAAMAALVEGLRDGRAGDGMVAAVGQVGQVLAAHFPRSPDDTNELPDGVIEL